MAEIENATWTDHLEAGAGVEWAVLRWSGHIGDVGHRLVAGPYPTRVEAELFREAHQAYEDRRDREFPSGMKQDPLYVGWRHLPQWYRAGEGSDDAE